MMPINPSQFEGQGGGANKQETRSWLSKFI